MGWKSIRKFITSRLDLEDAFDEHLAYTGSFIAALALVSGGLIVRSISKRKRAEGEREQLQEQLILSDRMASLGRLVVGIAHEFSNLLAGLRGYAQVAQMPGKEKRLTELPEVIIEIVDRGQDITENLLDFSERFQPSTEIIRPAQMIESIVRLMKTELETAQIDVKINIPEETTIKTDGSKLQQVLLNLIINAKHAMTEGGTLSFKIEEKGDDFLLYVSDTGTGIPEDVLPHIFEPFFTTKGSNGGEARGTGLGLSLSHGIMQGLGGSIEVESILGEGSTFKLTLPAK